ncbi:MAG: methylated-DNA--[protein]-cysteine S-methyltransferase [Candidatus Methanomethylophilaceae archaeon]|jgi:methylated-DNA-[protein]-cysteine S-methyltransferase|nr:methylated-DNA--[protein]-cysteine S-methyltransferase [Candidatus Methanomethylophilaceae archaeon]NLF33542.1 methylated-DNA--[protein]-cysteine S-methyltransferase [Thermoplasmatales archaeon]
MAERCIHTYVTLIGKVSICDDGEGGISRVFLPTENLPCLCDRESDVIAEAAVQISEYLSGKRRDFDVPLNPEGSEFQTLVWKSVSEIPYGQTCSYSDIASAIGRPSASRAVGTAVGCNPMPILIPCHRVLRSDGSIGGYSGGMAIKRLLLETEGHVF